MNHKQHVQTIYPHAAAASRVHVSSEHGLPKRHPWAILYRDWGPLGVGETYVWAEDVIATGKTERDAWRKASRAIDGEVA